MKHSSANPRCRYLQSIWRTIVKSLGTWTIGCLSTTEYAMGWQSYSMQSWLWVRVKPSLVPRLFPDFSMQHWKCWDGPGDEAKSSLSWSNHKKIAPHMGCHVLQVNGQLDKPEPKTVKESCSSLDTHHLYVVVHAMPFVIMSRTTGVF